MRYPLVLFVLFFNMVTHTTINEPNPRGGAHINEFPRDPNLDNSRKIVYNFSSLSSIQ